ncbi:MAG: NACHT domain-containing protein, partial [Burkholderiaceae bacterium]
LENPAMRHRALFFFRDPQYASARGGPFVADSEQDAQRQNLLKRRIERSGLPVLHYNTPGHMAEMLREQLWTLLDQEFPVSEVPDAQALEILEHRAFAASKLGPRFINDLHECESLVQALASGCQRVLINGPTGIGKSTMLAQWLRAWTPNHSENPRHIVLSHFLEANEDSAAAVPLIRRLIELIRQHIGSSEPIPGGKDALLTSLPTWLAEAHTYGERTQTRWIIALDGMDRLRTERNLLWLPSFIPATIQLVVSCRKGELLNALKRRGKWQEIPLRTLSRTSGETLLAHQMAVFKKTLSADQIAAILSDPRAGQPLFLNTLAEELRVFGSFEGLEGHLQTLLAGRELDDLYEQVLFRLETHHGREGVEAALSAICLSRSGLAEEEVLEISDLKYQARWAPIRLALGDTLSNAMGRVRCAHGYLTKAIRDRYFPVQGAEYAKRLALARWFEKRPLDRRRAWEQPYQLWRAQAYPELLALLSNRDVFELIDRHGGSQELHRYWIEIEAALGLTAQEHYRDCWTQWQVELFVEARIDLANRLQRLLRFSGAAGEFQEQLAEETLHTCASLYGQTDQRYLAQLEQTALTMMQAKNRLDRARELAENACIGIEQISGPNAPALAEPLLIIARVCLRQRSTQRGLEAARRALDLKVLAKGSDDPSLVPYLNCLTDLLLLRGGRISRDEKHRRLGGQSLLEGITLQSQCFGILRRTSGLLHLSTANSMIRTGRVFARCDEIRLAERAYMQALETRTQLLGSRHPLTLSARRLLEGVSSRTDP